MNDQQDTENAERRELETGDDDPSLQIVEAVADIEETDKMNLSPAWNCIDDVLENVFSTPPSPEAQMEISFNYEGYRITVEQNGTARFVSTN